MTARILVVEDDDETREAVAGALRDLGYDTAVCPDASTARAHSDVDIVVTDIRMPGQSGIELCAEIAGNRPDLPVILMTAFGDTRAVSLGLRAGASDFLAKPFSMSDLGAAIHRALDRRQRAAKVKRLTAVGDRQDAAVPGIIGSSPAMQAITGRLRQLANNPAPVLIRGDAGTGKELLARTIHALSDRQDGPFVTFDCTAFAPERVERELFGEDARTDVGARHLGAFRAAGGGTLYLKEIVSLPLDAQARLLRSIEQHRVRPAAAGAEVASDVRLVATSRTRLGDLTDTGKFRADLMFRLSTFQLELPTLRRRGNDVLELTEHFLRMFSQSSSVRVLDDGAKQTLLAYGWPGNVRELENALRPAVLLSQESVLTAAELPTRVQRARAPQAAESSRVDLDALERSHIERVLRETRGNRSEAARKLGIDRVTLYRKMKRYEVSE